MGIYARIYASAYGRDSLSVCKDDGRQVLIVNADGPFEGKPGDVLVELQAGPFNSMRAVPLDDDRLPIAGVMFGGRFVYSSDGRFNDLVQRLSRSPAKAQPIALHDRYEG